MTPKWMLRPAHEALNEHVSDWVFGNRASAKVALIAAYKGLNPRLKQALEEEVRHLVPGKLVVYRSMRPGQSVEDMGGMSVTDSLRTRIGDVHSWEVDADDIMLHYKQPDSWLSSKTYAHEREIILKPDARPRYLGPVTPEQRVSARYLRESH